MGRALDTMVFGSPNTCERAADWLDSLKDQANGAHDGVNSALDQASECWDGPAYDTFSGTHARMGEGFGTVADTAESWASAMRDFAGSIRSVQNAMQDILNKAHAGGLTVNGPFILAPENHLVAPSPTLANGAPDTSITGYQDRINAYNNQVDALNQQISLYNDLQDQVRDQRHNEDQAHYDRAQAMTTPADDVDDLTLALTGVAGGRTVISSLDGIYKAEMAKFNLTNSNADALQKLPAGGAPTQAQLDVINDVMNQQPQDSARFKAAQQWGTFNRTVPAGVRRALTAPNGLDEGKGGIPPGAGKLLSGFSYAGAGLTVVNEAIGAVRGEQSWSQFGVNSTGEIGGGLIGGRVGSVIIGGITGGPYGAAAGGIVGGTAGSKVVKDFITGWDQGMRQNDIDKQYAPIPETPHK